MAYTEVKSESYELLGGINEKVSAYLTGPNECRDMSNLHFRLPGALTKRFGTASYTGATVTGRITGEIEFQRLNGASYLVVTANTNAYTATTSGFAAFKSGLTNNAIFDFAVFVDRLFSANGYEFFKYDGTNTTLFSLPPGANGFGLTAVLGGSLIAGGVTGTFQASYGYLNDRGYFGPLADGVTIIIDGVTFNSIGYYGLTTPPPGYGVSAVVLYRSSLNGFDLAGTTTMPISVVVPGATFVDTGMTLTTQLEPTGIWFTLAPKYFEIYNNQLFMAGFSAAPSTAVWSDVGEPESIQPEFFAEFRTNDGDYLTGLKSYNGSLIVTKKNSFHRVTGEDPSNFLLQEISDQYGGLSNRAMVTWENILWFLDSKGIAQYDGANVSIISSKVESTFMSMNREAALDNAVGIHFKDSNEVWFGIPVNGATFNNVIVVYDYLTKAWTKYNGVNPSSLAMVKQGLSTIIPFVGSYTGSILYFGASFPNDSGAAITCMFRGNYVTPRGQTQESQFRMFYLNQIPILDPLAAVTNNITMNFRVNFGATVAATRTMSQNPYQNRVQFGIPARSIQAEMIHVSASLPLTITGYAFASRYQRGV